MKQFAGFKLKIICFLLLLINLFLIGCKSTESSLIENSENGSLTRMAFPTDTPSFSTSTSKPLVTDEPKATRLPTSIPVSTLMPNERESTYQDYMITNGGCDLPCWWGVKLGDSLEGVSQSFTERGMPWIVMGQSEKVDSDTMGTFTAGYYDREKDPIVARLEVNMEFHELNGSIDYIYVDIDRIRGLENSQFEFERDWEQYYLGSFLARYGKPTQIYFRIRNVGDLMITPVFSVSLLYREKGLAITYHIEGEWLDEEYSQVEICLDIQNARSLELSLFNPNNFDKWEYQFAPYGDELYELLTWEEETGMSLDTFYEKYLIPENLDCLTMNSN